MSRTHILAVGMIASALMVLAACSKSPEANNAHPPLPVEVVSVGDEASTPSNGASASSHDAHYAAVIAFDRESVLSPRVGGIVQVFPVTIGARLRRGSLVASLNDTPYRAALMRSNADAERLARAQERDRTLLTAGAVAPADVLDNQSALNAARAAQASASYDLASTRVRMPFDGVVLSKAVDVGATVAPGQPLASVADLHSRLIARVQVPSAIASQLQRGMAATISASGSAASLSGQILRSGALSDPRTGTVEVDVALPDATKLASGTVISVSFPTLRNASLGTGSAGAAQHIPAEALVDSHDGHGHVYIVDPRSQTARLIPITVYGFEDDAVRVSGIPDKAQVITVGAGYVANGQKVAVLAR